VRSSRANTAPLFRIAPYLNQHRLDYPSPRLLDNVETVVNLSAQPFGRGM